MERAILTPSGAPKAGAGTNVSAERADGGTKGVEMEVEESAAMGDGAGEGREGRKGVIRPEASA